MVSIEAARDYRQSEAIKFQGEQDAKDRSLMVSLEYFQDQDYWEGFYKALMGREDVKEKLLMDQEFNQAMLDLQKIYNAVKGEKMKVDEKNLGKILDIVRNRLEVN